jgi:hypothetical protein
MTIFSRIKVIRILLIVLVGFFSIQFIIPTDSIAWGFYGHRLINRKAIFTLPKDMISFYKKHIEFITEHAVDPDKRRYATKKEAFRHYIDIDHWGEAPFPDLPRNHPEAFWKFTTFDGYIGDVRVFQDSAMCQDPKCFESKVMKTLFYDTFIMEQGEESVEVDGKNLSRISTVVDLGPQINRIVVKDELTFQGILPYFFPYYYKRLVDAFRVGDVESVLRYSAEIGHYVSDAHVPLHTTVNYNGQLTDQLGIHAFWESRIPELFAEKEYDFFVGRAEYIPNIDSFIWQVVLESHTLVDSVLSIEQRLKNTFPESLQFCFDERLERNVFVQCPEFSYAYQAEMDGMVEDQMQKSIHALGSVWYSAWVDAGEQVINEEGFTELSEEFKKRSKLLEEKFKSGNIYGREH